MCEYELDGVPHSAKSDLGEATALGTQKRIRRWNGADRLLSGINRLASASWAVSNYATVAQIV